MSSNLHTSFLQLVRLGIGNTKNTDITEISDWMALKNLAERQGLSAVVVDGIGKLPKKLMPPKLMLVQWIGEVSQIYEERFSEYKKAISELAGFYNSHGFKMMVLKGYACSLDWPKPEHRPCGDIDIWLFGEQKAADAALSHEKGIQIDNSHHHHTVFDWQGFMVENHYDFINVHHHKSHIALEKILKELGTNDTYSTSISEEKVYLPSPDLHALFLMKHLMLHFSTGEMSLRQLLDWGFFVKAHGNEVDWERIESVFERFNMMTLYGIFNAICVEELEFDASKFHFTQFGPALKKRVMNEILSPEFTGMTPSSMLPRILFKYRRWKANGWKHRLCYSDTMWSAFLSGVWNHLLKPSSI